MRQLEAEGGSSRGASARASSAASTPTHRRLDRRSLSDVVSGKAVDAGVVRLERRRVGEGASADGDRSGRVSAGVSEDGAVSDARGQAAEADAALRGRASPDCDQVQGAAVCPGAERDVGGVGGDRVWRERCCERGGVCGVAELAEERSFGPGSSSSSSSLVVGPASSSPVGAGRRRRRARVRRR